MGGLYTLGYAQVLPQAPIGVSSLSTASPLLSVCHPAVPSSSLPAFQPQGFSGFYPPASSLLPSYSLTWPVSSAPGLGSPPLVSVVPCLPAVLYLVLRYFLLPLFALLLLAPLQVSMALHLRCLGLLRLIVYLQFAPGRSRVFSGLFSYSFCAAPLASAAGLFGFPSASAGSFINFVSSTPQPGSAQAYAPLSGTSTASSVFLSQCLVRVLLSLCSGFVARVATGAVAPVPEAFVPHLSLPPLPLLSALIFYCSLVAILTLAAGSSQAPLPTCSFSWSSS